MKMTSKLVIALAATGLLASSAFAVNYTPADTGTMSCNCNPDYKGSLNNKTVTVDGVKFKLSCSTTTAPSGGFLTAQNTSLKIQAPSSDTYMVPVSSYAPSTNSDSTYDGQVVTGVTSNDKFNKVVDLNNGDTAVWDSGTYYGNTGTLGDGSLPEPKVLTTTKVSGSNTQYASTSVMSQKTDIASSSSNTADIAMITLMDNKNTDSNGATTPILAAACVSDLPS